MALSGRMRIGIVAGFVLVIVVMAYALYRVFFAPAAPPSGIPVVEQPVPTTPGGLPLTPEGEVTPPTPAGPGVLPTTPAERPVSDVARGGITQTTRLLPSDVRAVAVRPDGEGLNYYNELDSTFYRIDRNGNLTQLSSRTFAQVESVAWSPVDDRAIMEFPDGSNIFFDFGSQQQAILPQHWTDFSFNSAGDNVVAKSIGQDASSRYLIVTQPNGSGARAVAPLGTQEQYITPTWSPNNQILAIAETGVPTADNGGDRQTVYLVTDSQTSNYPQITIEGRGLRTQWSPEGNQLLYSAYNSLSDYNPNLWVVATPPGAEGSRKINVGLRTWADKCAFADETTLYCAVPLFLEEGYGLVPELADTIPDEIYRIDLQSGEKSLIAQPFENYTIGSLMVSEDKQSLFFTDKADNGLHELKLR